MADGTRQATVPQLESCGNQPEFALHTLKVFRAKAECELVSEGTGIIKLANQGFPFALNVRPADADSRIAVSRSVGVDSRVPLDSLTAEFLFCRKARPINPSTTKTPPTTINQCGYCIPRNTLRPLRLQPELDQAADGFGTCCAMFLTPSVNLLRQSCRKADGADRINASLFFRAAA